MKRVPIGMAGEIFVAGPTLACGYINRPELDKNRLVVAAEIRLFLNLVSWTCRLNISVKLATGCTEPETGVICFQIIFWRFAVVATHWSAFVVTG